MSPWCHKCEKEVSDYMQEPNGYCPTCRQCLYEPSIKYGESRAFVGDEKLRKLWITTLLWASGVLIALGGASIAAGDTEIFSDFWFVPVLFGLMTWLALRFGLVEKYKDNVSKVSWTSGAQTTTQTTTFHCERCGFVLRGEHVPAHYNRFDCPKCAHRISANRVTPQD